MSRATDTSRRENRFQICLSDAEILAIDDWRFDQRIATRAEAVRQLVALGLFMDHMAAANARAVPGCSTPELAAVRAPEHASDCAVHNEPAFPAGPCDCGATYSQAKGEV